jgi:hypothetical protein
MIRIIEAAIMKRIILSLITLLWANALVVRAQQPTGNKNDTLKHIIKA